MNLCEKMMVIKQYCCICTSIISYASCMHASEKNYFKTRWSVTINCEHSYSPVFIYYMTKLIILSYLLFLARFPANKFSCGFIIASYDIDEIQV